MSEENRHKLMPENITRNKVVAEFDKIRQMQRQLFANLVESEIKLNEIREVVKCVRDCNPNRRCYRLMNDDILVESDIGNVLPSLFKEKDRVETEIEKIRTEISICAENLKEFRRNHNIGLRNFDINSLTKQF